MDGANEQLGDAARPRPDTIGVGWPTELPGAARQRAARTTWGVLLVVVAVVWAPLSVLVAWAGTIAVVGRTGGDGSLTPGLIDEPTLDTAAGASFVVLLFVAASTLLGGLVKATTRCSYRRAAATGTAVAVWAPIAAGLLALVLVGGA